MSLLRGTAVAALVALAVPAAAQDWKGQGRIEGRVLDPDGKPIAGAILKLELVGRGGTEAKTDKNGRWALGGIAAGRWNIDIEAPGYKTKRTYHDLASESARPAPAVVTMEKDVPKGPPPEVLAAVKAGDDAFQAGKYAEARAEYEKLLALRPDLANTLHLQIARCYDQEGNFAKELEHLKAAVALDPTNNNLKFLEAQVAIKAGQVDEGLATLKSVDDSGVTDPNVFFNIAVILLNQQRTDDAVTYLTKAVTVDPNYADGYFQRGLAYMGAQKYPEARADLEKFLTLAPGDARAEMAKKALEQLPK
jgi:tetratricopeptide (TPR) repeat protein